MNLVLVKNFLFLYDVEKLELNFLFSLTSVYKELHSATVRLLKSLFAYIFTHQK